MQICTIDEKQPETGLHATLDSYLSEAIILARAFPHHASKMPSEAHLQTACYSWWNLHFRQQSILYAIPNGGTRIVGEAYSMIAQGLTAGVFDLELKTVGGRSIVIELKNQPHKLLPATNTFVSSEQLLFARKMLTFGIPAYCAKTFLEFVVIVCHCLGVEPEKYL